MYLCTNISIYFSYENSQLTTNHNFNNILWHKLLLTDSEFRMARRAETIFGENTRKL